MIRFFWTRCDLCKCEFKKETMWKLKYSLFTRYICKECAPDYARAEFLSGTWGKDGMGKPSILHVNSKKEVGKIDG